jgi:hypothetical protein
MKCIYPLRGQNTEYFNVRAGGIYSYQCVLRVNGCSFCISISLNKL